MPDPQHPVDPSRAGADRGRPERLVVVAGTRTEVGKTWVSTQLIELLRSRGLRVEVRKPLQSHDPGSGEPTDAEVLAAASGEDPVAVCGDELTYPVAMAPPIAGEVLGRAVPSIAEIVSGLGWSSPHVGLVETVGGVRSPLGSDGHSGDLAGALRADVVVVVADAALGAIDAVRGAVDGLAPMQPLVFLNRFDPSDELQRRNLDWLRRRDSMAVSVSLDELARWICATNGAPR